MTVTFRWMALYGLLVWLLVACGQPTAPPSPTAAASDAAGTGGSGANATTQELWLVTHESFSVSEEVLAAFEQEYGAEVVLVPLNDSGAMVNQSILSLNNPLGDVMFGVDNTFLTRALNAGIFEPYESPALAQVPDSFEVDPAHQVTPIDYGDVCLNYDKAYFEAEGLTPPDSLDDLTDPAYQNMTVVENPASSSPGLAFLLATVAHFGEEGWQQYWADLRANGVYVTEGWSEAYFSEFTAGGGDGTRPIVVSYASSPAAAGGQTVSILSDGSCFRQIEFAGVLKNGKNPALARAFIDFMLTPAFQNDVSSQMYVYPVLDGATVSEEFTLYATSPSEPTTLTPDFIESNRETLIERWTEIVLR